MWSDQFATPVGRLTEFSLLDRMEDYFNRHASPVKRLTPPQEARRVVLVPLAARTAIFVFFGITIPGLRGFVMSSMICCLLRVRTGCHSGGVWLPDLRATSGDHGRVARRA
jgi:hypothetical protein